VKTCIESGEDRPNSRPVGAPARQFPICNGCARRHRRRLLMPLIIAAFLCLWLFWIVYWTASAGGNKRTLHQINPIWRALAIVFVVLVYAAIRHDPAYFNRRLLDQDLIRDVIGLVLTALGLLFSIWARRTLGTNWSANPTIKEGHELIQSGPYRWIRHPIYTGILLAVLGGNLADARIRDVYIFALVLTMLLLKLRVEERLLVRQFPEAYIPYRKRTKALIPFVF